MSEDRLDKAINIFVDKFGGSYKKLAPGDVRYRVYNAHGDLIAYAETVVVPSRISNAYPLPVLARKVLKLYDKRLNGVVIWICDDGIIYGKVNEISGSIKNDSALSGGEDLIIEYSKQEKTKYIKAYL